MRTPLTQVSLLFVLLIVSAASWAGPPLSYAFPELKELRDFNKIHVSGWSAVNDQVLMVSAGANRHYMLVLTRPDRDLLFSQKLAFTDSNGRVSARFDKVYATNTAIHIPNPIRAIYEIKGKAQLKAARLSALQQACDQSKPDGYACAELLEAESEQ